MSTERESARQTVADIRKKGDPIDGQWLLRRFAPGRIVAGTEGLAMGIAISPTPYWTLADTLLAAPPMAVGAFAVSAGIYGGISKLDQRRSRAREELQQGLRDSLKEPIDLIRFKDGRQKGLALRWYGADDAQPNTVVDTVSRFKHLVEFAEESGVTHIAVDAEWVGTNLGGSEEAPVDVEPYGMLKWAPTLIGDLKNTPVAIADNEAPDNVLFSTIDQARNLAEALEVSSKDLMLGELIKRTGNPQLIQEYRLFQRTDGKSVGRLLQSARGNLELLLNQETTVITRGRTDDGIPTRDRLHLSRRMSGEYVHEMSQPGPNAQTKSSTFEITSLLERFGARSLGDLTNTALRANRSEIVQEEILASIYLLALRRSNEQYDGTSAIAQSRRAHQDERETFFQRLQEEPRSYWRRWKERFRRPAPEDMPTIEYRARRGFGRSMTALAVFGIAATISASAHYGVDRALKPTWDASFEYCYDLDVFDRYEEDLTMTDDQRWERRIAECDALYREVDPWGQLALDAKNIPDNVRYDSATTTAETVYGVIGPDTLDAISPWLGDFIGDLAESNTLKSMPPAAYNGNFDESFLADAKNVDNNQTIYTISPLRGGSTTGYWYTKAFESLLVQNGEMRFTTSDTILPGVDEYLDLPSNHLSYDQLNQSTDYRVSTPYFSYYMQNTIAVLDGYQIVAAHVTDKDDPSLSFPVTTVQLTQNTNTYGYELPQDTEDQMRAAGIVTPVFTYWLSPLPEGVATSPAEDHYYQELRIPMMGDTPEAQVAAREALSNTIKQALGLPEDATPEEVLAAIQSKEYSFTPLSDQNVSLSDASAESPYQTLEDIGVMLAGMDKYNCNLASAAYVLATLEDSLAVNQASGFRDGNGDGQITQLEAHAWLIREGGSIIDPTPAGSSADSEALTPDDEPEDPRTVESRERSQQLLTGVGVAAGLGLALTAWRNRRKLLAIRDTLKVKTATTSKHAPKAMQVVNHAIYGPAGEQLDWTTHPQTDTAPVSEQLRSSLHPMVKTDAREKLQSALANPSLTGAEKRAVRRLISAARAAHRLG